MDLDFMDLDGSMQAPPVPQLTQTLSQPSFTADVTSSAPPTPKPQPPATPQRVETTAPTPVPNGPSSTKSKNKTKLARSASTGNVVGRLQHVTENCTSSGQSF